MRIFLKAAALLISTGSIKRFWILRVDFIRGEIVSVVVVGGTIC